MLSFALQISNSDEIIQKRKYKKMSYNDNILINNPHEQEQMHIPYSIYISNYCDRGRLNSSIGPRAKRCTWVHTT